MTELLSYFNLILRFSFLNVLFNDDEMNEKRQSFALISMVTYRLFLESIQIAQFLVATVLQWMYLINQTAKELR